MSTNTTATPQTDFYEYVNADWLKSAVIPADKPATGGFNQLVEQIEESLMSDFAKFLTTSAPEPDPQLVNFINFYRLAADYDKRNQDGATPLLPFLEEIEALKDLSDFQEKLPEWLLNAYPTPFSFDLDVDMKNTQEHIFFASAPGLFLPDKTYYEADNETGKKLLSVSKNMSIKLLTLAGKSHTEAEQIVSEATAFDALIVPHTKDSEENADIMSMYNPQTIEAFAANSQHLDFKKLLTALVGETPEKLIVTDLAFYQAFDQIVNPDTFNLLKSWLLVIQVQELSYYLSEEFRQTVGEYGLALSGSSDIAKPEKAAYDLASSYFDQIVGAYYASHYFGQAAKADVIAMVEKMITVYEERLAANTWLNAETKAKAILKLKNLGIQVGFPDEIPPRYFKLKTLTAEDGGTLLSNRQQFRRIYLEDMYAKWGQPVNRLEWEMSPDTVNAYYHPFKNIIVFPAAILQAPFYSLEQPSSANYGGIGAVIAHEISHAFDNNGAQFDEFGNLNNWWTDQDLATFKDLSQDMIEQFDGRSFGDGKVNGTLTVSENIADAGGLSCALEAAKSEDDLNLVAFFTNWATIWRMKASKEYTDLLLAIDVHSPTKLRANIQPQNLADFYTTFDIKPGDPMYLAPEKRISIW